MSETGDEGLRYRELVDAAPDGIVVCDRVGSILLVNIQAERMFGYRREELVGQKIELLIPERYHPRHPGHVASYTHAPHARPMGSGLELAGRRRDGTEFPVEISLSPIEADRGLLVAAAIRDVTDRRRIEAEARRANAYLLSAVDSIEDAFALYDEDDRIVLVNSSFRELIGRAMTGAIVGRRFVDLLDAVIGSGMFDTHAEPRDQVRARWLAYHALPSGMLELTSSAGLTLRIVDRPTAEHGTVSLLYDVSADRLHGEELRRAREQAEAASAAKSEFLASMSHELRTPMNAVLGFAQLLQRDRKEPLSGRQQERIDHVLRGGEHLLRLIDDVLDLSRIEAGGITISAEPVTLPGVLEEVHATLVPMAARAGISIVAAPVTGDLPPVIADRTRLAQILMNFGSNAIKYNRPGGHLAFRMTRQESTVRITVADDGLGIALDKQGKLFEPFQRAGQETGPIEGTGIGLAISKRLAELMHGNVGFSTVPDRGSEFWVEIPILVEPTAAAGDLSTGARGSRLASGRATHTVVYIEDNPSNLAFMRELMADLPSVELLTAPTAEIGVELVRARLPAVVIMDINLPGMSGVEATKLLKRWPETRAIPVIALTAAALARDTQRANDAGFHRYLTKPVKVDELTAVLEALLVPE